jgi:hypothetical protein
MTAMSLRQRQVLTPFPQLESLAPLFSMERRPQIKSLHSKRTVRPLLKQHPGQIKLMPVQNTPDPLKKPLLAQTA